jgi:transcriptional regulator GlxA family with amidase domain
MQPRAYSNGTPGQVAAGATGLQTAPEKVLDRRVRAVLALFARCPTCSASDLAKEVQLSRGQLQRLFKQEMGVPLGDYLVEQRLKKGAQLLASSNMSIKEIAFAAGYEHHSSFTRAFENRFSVSPKQYRDQNGITEC